MEIKKKRIIFVSTTLRNDYVNDCYLLKLSLTFIKKFWWIPVKKRMNNIAYT